MSASVPISTDRRTLGRLGLAAAGACALPWLAKAQGSVSSGRWKGLRVTQLLDMSPDQQELSRDYATGMRLAFVEQARLNLPAPQLQTMEIDGSSTNVQLAVKAVRDDPSQVALVGAVGDRLALNSMVAASNLGLSMAHVAPWLADSRFDLQTQLFPIFASRSTQIEHALKSLQTMSVGEMGVIYASPREANAFGMNVESIAASLKLKVLPFTTPAGGDQASFARSVRAKLPSVLLFMGGSIELAGFTQGLSGGGKASFHYMISLSDVDVSTLKQVGVPSSVPMILTQVVPNPQTSQLASVRSYRQLLAQLFEEDPSPMSLAGYLAGRFALQTLGRVSSATPDRGIVLAEFQRRQAQDLGGYRVAFGESGRGSNFVSQTLLSGSGKLLG